jgi:hypothetical protein
MEAELRADEVFWPGLWASDYQRAITVYERVGFSAVRVFSHWTSGAEWEFVEMERPA